MKVWRTLPGVSASLMALAGVLLMIAISAGDAISFTHSFWLLRTAALVAVVGATVAWFDRQRRLHRQAKTGDCKSGAIQARRLTFAASALVPLVLIGFAFVFVAHDLFQAQRIIVTHASPSGRMALSDGTQINVDIHSELEVDYRSDARIVHMHAGAAVFDVQKEENRRFIVRTPLVEAVAVGTIFGVSIEDGGSAVTVSEGSVKVRGYGRFQGRIAWVRAGEELSLSGRDEIWPSPTSTAGTRGVRLDLDAIELRGLSVAEGIEQLNRRNRVQIIVDTPSVGAKQIAFARVPTGHPESYAETIASGPGVKMIVDRQRGIIRLSD